MSTRTEGLLKTFQAAADYSTKQYYIVWVADNTATLADDADVPGENIMGAIQNKPAAAVGAAVEVAMPHGGGTAKVICGETISTVGNELTTDASGKAIVTTTSDDYVFGLNLQTGVANDIIEYVPVYNIVD